MNTPVKIKRIGQPTHYYSPSLIKKNELTVGITQNEYKLRRNNLFGKLKKDSLFIIPSSYIKYVSPDIIYKFRQNPNFLYITGFLEPNSICVLHKKDDQYTRYYLFVTEYNQDTITWDGHIAGTKMTKELFNVDNAYNIDDLKHELKEIILNSNIKSIYYDTINSLKPFQKRFIDIELCTKIENILKDVGIPQSKIQNKAQILIEKLRLIKSENEVALMKKSGKCAAESMLEVIKHTKPGTLEDRLASIFEFGCRMRGAARLSAPVTISNGTDNNILHYLNNDKIIKSGNLCLLDSGSELYGYCSDITRVFPSNGVFTIEQLNVYNIVLDVQKELFKLCKVGNTLKKLDLTSQKMIIDRLIDLGIIKNNSRQCIKKTRMWHSGGVHFVSHYIGLSIHDTPLINNNVKFEKNMAIAVEPGIYLPDCDDIPKEYRNIGIRIEDTVLITDDECLVLTDKCTKDPNEIMKIMGNNNDDIFKNARQGIWDDTISNNNSNSTQTTNGTSTLKRSLFSSFLG